MPRAADTVPQRSPAHRQVADTEAAAAARYLSHRSRGRLPLNLQRHDGARCCGQLLPADAHVPLVPLPHTAEAAPTIPAAPRIRRLAGLEARWHHSLHWAQPD